MPYYTEPSALTLFIAMITAIGFLAFVTWVIFGAIFKELMVRHQKMVNTSKAVFLIYSAIMGSGLVELWWR